MDLRHYGVARKSGRYPWGSGDDPQRSKDLKGYIKEQKEKGLSEVDIAKGLGMTTTQLRARQSLEKAEKRKADTATVIKLKNKGMSNTEIGRRMGINESSVRSLLNPVIAERTSVVEVTANMLREQVAEKKYLDVGIGVERHLGVSRVKLDTAISQLRDNGYKLHYIQVQQLGTGKKTTIKTLTKDDVTYSELYKNKDNIRSITSFSEDGGRSFLGLEPIKSISNKRILIKYAEDGGVDKDGVIELRRNVEDISLGNSKYAQVRIGVDDTHYLKGMAIYSDKIPTGYDVIFNTNKKRGTPPDKVFKELKEDPDNPFGSTVRQQHYIDSKGKKQLSALNIVNEEGDWTNWSKSLSSQVLSKQRPDLAKKQLELAYESKKKEYDEIMTLTNPTVRRKLLESFSDDVDSAAVHLKAAAMPRQGNFVIMPFPSMRENEVYAPKYRDGETVVLIRHPHGGIFEIPTLRVNNKAGDPKKLLGQASDAIGIHPKVAERLSGADFDGDTVLVIPNNDKSIRTSAPLKGLANFDPKEQYKAYPGMPRLKATGLKMGEVSNLITDMTIKGADTDEIARAVRHSMVVIDAEKHHLNYKQSYIDNGISELRKKYQGSSSSGASTIISRASSQARIPVREDGKIITDPITGKTKRVYVDKETGKKLYTPTGETYRTSNGKTTPALMRSTRMAEADDAFELTSGSGGKTTPIEAIYATHANKLKALGNNSRKAMITTPPLVYSPEAKLKYKSEVVSLQAKLNIALMNAPLERQAQIFANSVVSAKKASNHDMTKEELKKVKNQALMEARLRVNPKGKTLVDITDKEWEAIQSGAVSNTTLSKILNNTDLDRVKQLSTPRSTITLPTAKLTRAKAMLAKGRTQAEIADALGVSVSTLSKALSN